VVLPNFNKMMWFDGSYNGSIDNPQKYKNEFESFKRKLGKHKYWFESLELKKQWDLLFIWKKQKYFYQNTKNNQVSLRKFLYEKRNSIRFFVSKERLRESALNNLFNKNI
jgi:hypothetical protein